MWLMAPSCISAGCSSTFVATVLPHDDDASRCKAAPANPTDRCLITFVDCVGLPASYNSMFCRHQRTSKATSTATTPVFQRGARSGTKARPVLGLQVGCLSPNSKPL